MRCLNWTEFGRSIDNDMPMTTKMSTSKPDVEFQYNCRSFSQNGSSNISAVEILEFGMPIYFYLPKRKASLNPKPEVDL